MNMEDKMKKENFGEDATTTESEDDLILEEMDEVEAEAISDEEILTKESLEDKAKADDKNDVREIKIEVNTLQEYRDGEPDEIELYTEGVMYKKKDAIYLAYDESELSGIANNKVVLKIKDNESVQMNRFGEYKTVMLFKKKKRQTSFYSTPYGEFRVEILTDKVEIELKEDSGQIYIEYTVSISGSPELKNKLSIYFE